MCVSCATYAEPPWGNGEKLSVLDQAAAAWQCQVTTCVSLKPPQKWNAWCLGAINFMDFSKLGFLNSSIYVFWVFWMIPISFEPLNFAPRAFQLALNLENLAPHEHPNSFWTPNPKREGFSRPGLIWVKTWIAWGFITYDFIINHIKWIADRTIKPLDAKSHQKESKRINKERFQHQLMYWKRLDFLRLGVPKIMGWAFSLLTSTNRAR